MADKQIKRQPLTIVNCIAGFVRCRTLDSRFAVPCPSDRNALRNPQRQLTSDRCAQYKETNYKN